MKSSGLSCSIWRFAAISMVAALALVFSLAAVIMPANPAMADPHTVTSLDDSGAGSLRWAIANATASDTIDFAVTGTITLASQLTINKSLTITGPGEANLAINGNDNSRVFYINNSTVDMSGMTIRNGNVSHPNDGGGLYNDGGNVTMTDCTVSGNEANFGGGLYNNGMLTMTSCTVSGNTASYGGGGIDNEGDMTMTNCTVSGNTAWGSMSGGGIYNNGELTMTSCTVSGNEADRGGGIDNNDELTMTGCTVSGNTAGGGGGIDNEGDMTMTNCTVSGNTAEGGDGGGINNIAEVGNVTMTCTIVYGNTPDDIDGGYTDAGENIVGDPDPLLGLLQDNGGPTKTHALMPGSPAIDTCIDCTVAPLRNVRGNGPTLDGLTLETDQRGQPRPVDGDLDGSAFCDVGAYEKQISVGGIVEPVDKLSLLAPWLVLAAVMAVAITIAVVVRRRMA